MNKTQEALVITMEECGEVIQECSKMLRFGHKDSNDQATDKIERLSKEVGDLFLMIDHLVEQGLVDPNIVSNQKLVKAKKLKEYSGLYS